MTHPQQNHEGPCSSFIITQFALGSPLQFEPALGSKELDKLVNNYVPGSAMPQQKRAQVVLEFLNSIDALSYTHPVSIRYRVPQILTPQMMPRHLSMPSMTTSSSRASYDYGTAKEEVLNTSKSTGSLKRSREEATSPNALSAKRLPGFSIMTKDGIDITDLASRGPKTKEQRDHAALMRKLKACAACKRSKQRCDPSHHHPAQFSPITPSSATTSNRSARFSYNSSAGGSRGSISPQSSLGKSFSQSPTQGYVDHTVAETGRSFSPLLNAKPSLSPSDFTLSDTLLTDSGLSALPMQDLDSDLFQLADMELDSWNADFTVFPPADNNTAWNSHEDIFALDYGYTAPPITQGDRSSEQVQIDSSCHVTQSAGQGLSRQDHDRKAHQPGQLVQDSVYSDSCGIDFDIGHWLHINTDPEDRKDPQTQRATNGYMDMSKDNPFQRALHNPVVSRDEDYILYPDSPQFDWELEHHLISCDIGSKIGLLQKGVESEASRKRDMDVSPHEQAAVQPLTAGVRSPGSKYYEHTVQSTQLCEIDQPHRYLPSPSPSNGSEDVERIYSSDSNMSEANGMGVLSHCSTQSNNAHDFHERLDHDLSNAMQQQYDLPASRNCLVDESHRVDYRTSLSPSNPHNLRPVITADVDVGSKSQLYRCDHCSEPERPRKSSSELPMPDVQNHTMNLIDQQVQDTLTSQQSQVLPMVSPQSWEHIWKERDLRRASLLEAPVEAIYASQLRISIHDLTQTPDTADDVYDAFTAEDRRQSRRSVLSSDLPGEDGNKYSSIETLTQQHRALSQYSSRAKDNSLPQEPGSHRTEQECSSTLSRSMGHLEKMKTIIVLCLMMTISLLWTMSLLMAVGNDLVGNLNSEASSQKAVFYPRNSTTFPPGNSQDDIRSISVGHDYGSPSRFDPGPGLKHSISREDSLYSGSDHVKYIESNHILDSRPDDTESEMNFIYDQSINETFSDELKRQPSSTRSPTPSLLSLSSTPATIMAPSITKTAATWTTHLPARSTSQPSEIHLSRALQSRGQSSVRSPFSRLLPSLKRAWNRHFNIGHLATRITVLTII